MPTGAPNCDVAIIGGGPAGSGTAAYLARAGLNCIVFERELFPRLHVGESLVPSSTRVFKELDFLEQMEENRFPHKHGAVWTSGSRSRMYHHDWEGLETDCQAAVRFEERAQPGVDRNYTYHVDRARFDLLLLQHACKSGAKVYEGIQVSRVEFSENDFPRLRFSLGRKRVGLTARMVVDASGRRTILGNQLRLRVHDPVFDQYALHTWFEGYDRSVLASQPEMKDYIFIHFLPLTNSWIWQIPITDSITSFGVVTQKKHFAHSRISRQRFFWNCIGSRPDLREALGGAQQLRPLKEEADYSYALKQICGDGFLMVGDAARFVDPIFSSGVSIALNSARLASRDILKAAQEGDFSRGRFDNFETTMHRGMRNWYEFIRLYYRLNVLFTAFVTDPRYRLDVLKLLQGDVYDEDHPAILTRMGQIVDQVEENEGHPWHSLLGDLTADAFKPG